MTILMSPSPKARAALEKEVKRAISPPSHKEASTLTGVRLLARVMEGQVVEVGWAVQPPRPKGGRKM